MHYAIKKKLKMPGHVDSDQTLTTQMTADLNIWLRRIPSDHRIDDNHYFNCEMAPMPQAH